MIPSDPLYARQWHFGMIGNIQRIWDDYSGAGVRVLVVDDGVQYTHPDLQANYVPDHFAFGGIVYDPTPVGAQDAHGTACAGLIAAAAGNGRGGVGVAWGASITGVNMLEGTQYRPDPVFYASLRHGVNFDISTNSWGMEPLYGPEQNLNNPGSYRAQIHAIYGEMSAQGRGGLGTVIVQSAGNSTLNAQGDGLKASRFTITVAAVEQSGFVAGYSNWGACILVSAPAASVTTDLTGDLGSNRAGDGDPLHPDYMSTFGGTSAATPVVTGVVALMLEANPDLGWRDVQDILATSARLTGSAYGSPATGTEVGRWRGLGNDDLWNGGDRAFNVSYGYGLVDAFAATRMAEVWHLFKPAETSANEISLTRSYSGPAVRIPPDGTSGEAEIAFTLPDTVEIDQLEVTLTLQHSYARDLEIFLYTPDGTPVVLMYREGGVTLLDDFLTWTFGVDALRGYSTGGTWTLRFVDVAEGDIGFVTAARLTFYGSPVSADDVHHITEDFRTLAAIEPARAVLSDSNGGTDWLNLAAIAGNVVLGLNPGGTLSVAGTAWARLAAGPAQFENAVTGDGNDSIGGNALPNHLAGMRGNDTLRGLLGDDTLEGGDGNDSLIGGGGDDALSGGAGQDFLNGQFGHDLMEGGEGDDWLLGNFGNDTLLGGAGNDTLSAQSNDDSLLGGDGNDLLIGGFGNDTMHGEAGADTLDGGGNDDRIFGGAGDDLARGGGGADTIQGEAGNDTLNGGDQGDLIFGGLGNDLVRGDGGNDTLDGGAGNDTLTGGANRDTFIFGANSARDRITDFEDNLDRLHLATALWGGGLTAQQVVSTYAFASGGNTVFDFGGGNVLTVAGIGDPNLLVNDILLI